jgi:putative membrane protein
MADRSGAQVPPLSQMAIVAGTALWTIYCLLTSPYPYYAPLQNGPTLAILGGVSLWAWRRPQSTSALACFCAFLALHALGGKYIYSYVPYESWARTLGLPSPNRLLGLPRNSYDRLVHFSFGVLMVHPIRQALMRQGGVGPRLSLYVVVEFVMAGSCLYEIFEWLLTVVMATTDADAYNGQQGDLWDSQKDMACASGGAILAAVIIVARRMALRRASTSAASLTSRPASTRTAGRI